MSTKKKMDLKVEQQEGTEPVEKTILAQAIVDISRSLTALHKSGLNEKAILALVKDYTGISKAEVKRVLDALADLKRNYCV